MSRKSKKLAGIIVGVFAGVTAILGAGTIAAYLKDKSDYDVNKPEAFKVLNEFALKNKELQEKYNSYQNEVNQEITSLDPTTQNQYQGEIDSLLKSYEDQLNENKKYINEVNELNAIQNKYRLGHHLGNKYFYQDKKWRDIADKLAVIDQDRGSTDILLKSNQLMDYLKLNLDLRISFNSTLDVVLDQPQENIFNNEILNLFNEKNTKYTQVYKSVETKLSNFENLPKSDKFKIVLDLTKKLDDADKWLRTKINDIWRVFNETVSKNYATFNDFINTQNLSKDYAEIKNVIAKLDAQSIGKQLTFDITKINQMAQWVTDLSNFWNNVSITSQKQNQLKKDLEAAIKGVNKDNTSIKNSIDNANLSSNSKYANTQTKYTNFKSVIKLNNDKFDEFQKTADWKTLLQNSRDIVTSSASNTQDLFNAFKAELSTNIQSYFDSLNKKEADVAKIDFSNLTKYDVKVPQFSKMVETIRNNRPIELANEKLNKNFVLSNNPSSDIDYLSRTALSLVSSEASNDTNFDVFKKYMLKLNGFVSEVVYGSVNNKYEINNPANSTEATAQMDTVIKNATLSLFHYNSIDAIQKLNNVIPNENERIQYVTAWSNYFNKNFTKFNTLVSDVETKARSFTGVESKQLQNAFNSWLITYVPILKNKVEKQVIFGDSNFGDTNISNYTSDIKKANDSLDNVVRFIDRVHELYDKQYTLSQFVQYVPEFKNGSGWTKNTASLSNFSGQTKSSLDFSDPALTKQNVLTKITSGSNWSQDNLESLVNLINGNKKIVETEITQIQNASKTDSFISSTLIDNALRNIENNLQHLAMITRAIIQLSPDNTTNNVVQIANGGSFRYFPVPLYYEIGEGNSIIKVNASPNIGFYPGFQSILVDPNGTIQPKYTDANNNTTNNIPITFVVKVNGIDGLQSTFNFVYHYTSVVNDFNNVFNDNSVKNNITNTFNYNWSNTLAKVPEVK